MTTTIPSMLCCNSEDSSYRCVKSTRVEEEESAFKIKYMELHPRLNIELYADHMYKTLLNDRILL